MFGLSQNILSTKGYKITIKQETQRSCLRLQILLTCINNLPEGITNDMNMLEDAKNLTYKVKYENV